ncbi:hypothetical protein Lal_00031873 [Lupinus albus]|nr:hypothetical protein Lal_00031873 [Lupinus albus]
MALGSKNKLGFVDGTIPKPLLLDPVYAIWNICNNLVVSWITQSIEPSIVQSVLWMESAQEIWDDLHERYHQGDMFKISELIGEIHSIKQGNKFIKLEEDGEVLEVTLDPILQEDHMLLVEADVKNPTHIVKDWVTPLILATRNMGTLHHLLTTTI